MNSDCSALCSIQSVYDHGGSGKDVAFGAVPGGFYGQHRLGQPQAECNHRKITSVTRGTA